MGRWHLKSIWRNIAQNFKVSELAAIQRGFRLFSCIVFVIVLCVSSAAFFFSLRQVGYSTLESELSLAVETQRLRLTTEMDSELALISQMADSRAIQQYFLDPGDQILKGAAMEEFAAYRRNLKNNSIFWISDVDKLFYYDHNQFYRLDPSNPENYWYNLTLYGTEKYNLNINYNPDMRRINLWINAPVFQTIPDEGKKPIGMIGTGIDLGEFFDFVYHGANSLVTFYLFNSSGEIIFARDRDLVLNKVLLKDHLGGTGDRLIRAAEGLEDMEMETFVHDDALYAVCAFPRLQWYLVGSIPIHFSALFNPTVFVAFVSVLLLALFIVVVFNIYIGCVGNEIEEKNRSLITLNDEARAASEKSKNKSVFLARMSHEIRTPMNAIIGMSELAEREHGTDKALEYIAGIKSAGAGLLAIINDILDFSRIESGQFTLVPAPYDTASLLNGVLSVVRIRLGEKPIELTICVDPLLPIGLMGDATRVRQVLLNLLSNAVKYTDGGFIRFSVAWQEMPGEAARLTFTVADSGIGIKSENLPRLFGDFVRIEDKRSIEGTGLGLVITRNLCQAMGGNVTVESEYGKGSVFTATLCQPIADRRPMGSLERRKTSRAESGPQTSERRNAPRTSAPRIAFTAPTAEILLVDDMPSNLLVAEGLLAPYKTRIVTCQNGGEAVELTRSRPFDLVFMDHMMPGMDGMEATAAIRAMGERGKMPIIALTANVITGMRETFLRNGFSDFLSKPIELPKLAEIMEKWIPAEKRGPAPDAAPSGGAAAARHPAIEGVDTLTGQAHVDGVSGRYLDLLEMFCRDARTRLPLLARAPREEECKAFTTQVHALKGALAAIGADDLAAAAARLEGAGRDGDVVAIHAHLDAFRKDLGALLTRMDAALAQARPRDDGAGGGNGGEWRILPWGQKTQDGEARGGSGGDIGGGRERELLTQLETALEREDLDAMDKALEDLKALPPSPGTRDALSGIVESILSADFKKAKATVQALNVTEEIG
jgi:signal transduction histidine kinase/CheY-like chemotaxis protein/HPt (histidine-containing phosphotransfer) domain-containing protein